METRKMIVGMVAVVLVLMSGTAWATQYYVSPDGNDNNSGTTWATAFATIGKGISDANDGDIVDVNEGTYYETIDFAGKAIKVRSTDPNDWDVVAATIIDANDESTDAVMFASGEDANTVLRGLTVTGASVGVHVDSVGPVISRCILQGNRTGVKYTKNSTGTLIVNNKIHDSNGYGVFGHKGDATIKSNWIYDSDKGIKLASGASADIYNNTIVNNISYGIDKGGGQGVATISNCIIWDCNNDLEGCSATYSCISDCNDASGTGNICGDGNDPNFVDADANDFHLQPDSPCIEAGDPCYVPDSNETDIDNNARIHGLTVDISADELLADWYVDDDRGSNGTGDSWDTAFKYLQDALANSSLQSGDEIWVAQGIYKPTTSTTDRTASFQIKDGVTIKGGYGGLMFSDPVLRDTRDYRVYETILSGDIDGDDVLDNGNSYHVVKFLQGSTGVVLDGLTITMGMTGDSTEVPWYEWPDRCGGGVLCWKVVSVTISNCVIRDNRAWMYGGGMFNWGGSSPTVTNCFFINNTGVDGGGMCNHTEYPSEASSPTLTNCVFSGNYAHKDGGGMYSDDSYPTLINCTFTKNRSESSSGGMFGSNGTVTNCIFWGNIGRPVMWIQGMQMTIEDSSVIKYSCIQDEDPDDESIPFGGAENNNIDDDPRFVDTDEPAGPDGILGTFDDGLRLRPGSPNRCVDSGNNNDIDNTGVKKDVIGNARKMDGDGDGSRTVDRGAYELPRIWHVDGDATGGANNGTSWDNAFLELRDAISALSSKTDGNEIWVAEGKYKPHASDQTVSFELIGGVPIRGGYAGYNETDPYEQNFLAYETILSGDIDGNGNFNNNSYHVVTGTDGAILEGFTITWGNAYNNDGGGIYCNGASPTISSCVIKDNRTDIGDGGGIYCNNSSPVINNCKIIGNEAIGGGGGIYCNNSSPKIINCTIALNASNHSGEGGGGIFCYDSSPTIRNCVISRNYAKGLGGGMYNECKDSGSSPTVTNCFFIRNHGQRGGGMYNIGYMETVISSPTVISCVFSKNSAGGSTWSYGGGITNEYYAHSTLINCTFSGNLAVKGGGMSNSNSALLSDVTNCIFWGNYASDGDQYNEIFYEWNTPEPNVTYCDVEGGYGGGTNIGSDPDFIDADDLLGPDGLFGTRDDGLKITAYSPCVDKANGSTAPLEDITGRGRVDVPYSTGDESSADMGAYESPTVWFVKKGTSVGDDGHSWTTAFDELRDALNPLVNTDLTSGNEIWVAKETYKPDDETSADRSKSFQLVEGVAVYGGFEGDATKAQRRDWTTFNQTVLSGDIDGDLTLANNSYHVVMVVMGADNVTLDGFTIKGGNATDSAFDVGGGIYCEHASSTISNCVIRDNKASLWGGGIGILRRVHPTNVRNCLFINNTAPDGGGMYNENCYVTVTNCVFSGNDSSQNGGGIYNYESFSSLINCTFIKNNAEGSGGGMYNYNYRTWQSTVTNCIFWGNKDTYDAGPPETWLTDETAQIHGGAVVNYSCIQGDWTGDGGIGNTDADPKFVDENDPDGADGIFGTLDDGLRLMADSPCIDAADGDAAPSTDILGLRRYKEADIGAYEFPPRVVVMCWIDESSPYYSTSPSQAKYQRFIDDLDAYRNLLDSRELDIVKSGCLVPPKPLDDYTKVLPYNYTYDPANPPEGISVEECNRPPSESEYPGDPGYYNEIIVDFDRIRDGVVPNYLLLIADHTGSMYQSPSAHGGDAYTEFKTWINLPENYPDTDVEEYILPREENEDWVDGIRRAILLHYFHYSILGVE